MSLSKARSCPLMKPHLNSLDPDFLLDVHHFKCTHEYQSAKNARFIQIKIHVIF